MLSPVRPLLRRQHLITRVLRPQQPLHCGHSLDPASPARNDRVLVPKAPPPAYDSPRRSALDPLTFVAAIAVTTGIAYAINAYTSHVDKSASDCTPDEKSPSGPSASDTTFAMAPATPAGRPGNLTPEQEQKLKEMWSATLDIFGVGSSNSSEVASSASGQAAQPSTEAPDSSKKKKSRLGLFNKKEKHDEKKSNGSTASSIADSAPENDKHGQTKDFQQALASQSPDSLREAFWSMVKHDHPDALLLRFLRARKWDVQAALIMLISTMHWRGQEMHVDDSLMWNGEGGALKEAKEGKDAAEKKEGDDFMAQLRMGKSFLHGTDKDGRPCCYVRARLHRQGEQSERSLEQFTVYEIETARMLLRPPVDTATIVFDMTDFSMANMDYTPVKFMIKCFEANYPESLGSVLVYKAPWLFNQIWKIIRGWLDPVVAGKVHFCTNVDDLAGFIPKSQIAKELGGEEAWEYKYIEPREGENKMMDDTEGRDKILGERAELVKSFEGETLAWGKGEDAGQGRGRLAERLAENYWRLDPYVRAKSLADRQGVIGEGGKLNFYPESQPSSRDATEKSGQDHELD